MGDTFLSVVWGAPSSPTPCLKASSRGWVPGLQLQTVSCVVLHFCLISLPLAGGTVGRLEDQAEKPPPPPQASSALEAWQLLGLSNPGTACPSCPDGPRHSPMGLWHPFPHSSQPVAGPSVAPTGHVADMCCTPIPRGRATTSSERSKPHCGLGSALRLGPVGRSRRRRAGRSAHPGCTGCRACRSRCSSRPHCRSRLHRGGRGCGDPLCSASPSSNLRGGRSRLRKPWLQVTTFHRVHLSHDTHTPSFPTGLSPSPCLHRYPFPTPWPGHSPGWHS